MCHNAFLFLNLQLPTLLSSVHCTVSPSFSLFSLKKSLTVAHSRMSSSALDCSLKAVVITCVLFCAIGNVCMCWMLSKLPMLSIIHLSSPYTIAHSLSLSFTLTQSSHPHPFSAHPCSLHPWSHHYFFILMCISPSNPHSCLSPCLSPHTNSHPSQFLLRRKLSRMEAYLCCWIVCLTQRCGCVCHVEWMIRWQALKYIHVPYGRI